MSDCRTFFHSIFTVSTAWLLVLTLVCTFVALVGPYFVSIEGNTHVFHGLPYVVTGILSDAADEPFLSTITIPWRYYQSVADSTNQTSIATNYHEFAEHFEHTAITLSASLATTLVALVFFSLSHCFGSCCRGSRLLSVGGCAKVCFTYLGVFLPVAATLGCTIAAQRIVWEKIANVDISEGFLICDFRINGCVSGFLGKMGYEPHLGLRALEHTTALIIASLVSYLLQELTQPNKQGNGTEGSEEERVPLTLPYEEEVVRTTPQLPPYQNHARHALNRSPEPKPVQTSGEANNNNNNNDPEQLI